MKKLIIIFCFFGSAYGQSFVAVDSIFIDGILVKRISNTWTPSMISPTAVPTTSLINWLLYNHESITKSRADIISLRADLSKQKTEHAALKAEHTKFKTEHTYLRSQITAIKEAQAKEVAALKTQITSLKSTISKQATEIRNLKSDTTYIQIPEGMRRTGYGTEKTPYRFVPKN